MTDQGHGGAAQPVPAASLWRALSQAIAGSEADYTKISLNRAIFLLAIPMMLELLMESTFAVVDIYFVSQLGASAVATVGLTETYLYLLYSLAIGLATAVTAIVARRCGEGQREAAAVSAVQAILLGILVSLPFCVAGLFFSRELLALMGADAWALSEGYRFTQWMLGGNVVIVLIFIINAVFRGAGDAAIAMRVLLIANGVNLVLDPLLIFGWGPVPAFGVEGAGIATTCGRAVGVAVQLWSLFHGGKHIRVMAAQCRLNIRSMINIAYTSLGGIGQMLVSMTSWIFLMRILADVGSVAVAGATITARLFLFTLMPTWGLANAVATLVGQNLGAGQPERAEKVVWKIGYYNMAFLLGVSLLFFFCNEALIGIFTADPAVIAVGARWLRILSYSYFVYGWWSVAVQAFNGAGDTRTPTYINLVFFWLIQIPLSWWLALPRGWEEDGVFWGVFISETGVGLFTLWLFTRGGWKNAQV
ncbi:MAG: MATE family efflux transporter [Pseudomonadales bacterium]|jgi:putative MATE family efflux protein|nr:MATE family efflux transporter [Pseudomonadales bacterium]